MNRILEKAPASGFVIACLSDQLIFAPYKICNGVFTAEGWDVQQKVSYIPFPAKGNYMRCQRPEKQPMLEQQTL